MQRFEYIIKRLFFAIIVLINISIVTFFISRVLPSDPAAAWVGSHPTPEQIAKATVYLGLDKPIYTQYWIYISSILQGDLGTSIKTHQPIISELRTYLPATLELVIASTIIAIIIGIPLGVLSGAKKGGWMDNITRLVSIAGVSIPTFWLGLMLQLIFFAKLGILPIGGRISTEVAINFPVEQITGFYVIDSLASGNWEALRSTLIHLILPAFTLATYAIGLTIRMTRSTMIEVLEEGYITVHEPKKYGSTRQVYLEESFLTGKTRMSLKNYVDHLRPKFESQYSKDYLFIVPATGKPYVRSYLHILLSKLGKQVYPEFQPYSMRHWAAVSMIIKGWLEKHPDPLRYTQRFLGHEERGTTEIYITQAEELFRQYPYNWAFFLLKEGCIG